MSLLRQRAGRFLEKHCVHWKVIPIIAVYTYFFFWHVLAGVRLVLWRQMLQDYLLIIALPLYLAIFSEIINDIFEYSLYESQQLESNIDTLSKDVYLSVWNETLYYQFLDKKNLKPCRFVSDEADILEELRRYVAKEESEPEAE